MDKAVLDTSVIIEYIIARSTYRPIVENIFQRSLQGFLKLYITPIILSEILYTAARIYEAAKLEDPNREAYDYAIWVKSIAEVTGISESVALRAGELKKSLGIALPDCYVIATAESMGATPIFKRVEKEMKPVLQELRKLGVKFLDELNREHL